MVTAQRREAKMMNAPVALAVMAQEEQLGDLKLYRIPEPVTVNAKGLKQVAFLDKGAVEGEFLYTLGCDPWDEFDDEPVPTSILFATKNDAKHGLGAALPTGGFTLFEPSRRGELLVGEQFLRDYAVGQDVELDFGESRQVMGDCSLAPDADEPDDRNGKWSDMSVLLTNANNHDVTVRLVVGAASEWEVKGLRGLRVKDGEYVAEITVRSGTERRIVWKLRLVPEVEE